VSLLFFGCFCVIVGYLIFRSGYLPKTIGVLMQIAGVCYLTNSFALILSPAVANRLFPAILVPAFIGEASLPLAAGEGGECGEVGRESKDFGELVERKGKRGIPPCAGHPPNSKFALLNRTRCGPPATPGYLLHQLSTLQYPHPLIRLQL